MLIADDELLARARLRELIEAEEDLQMTGECSDGAETLEAIRETSPELVFLDVRMPVVKCVFDLDASGYY